MSQDKTGEAKAPVDVARKIIELLNARDLDGLADYQQQDIVEDFVAVGPYRGQDEVRRFFEGMFTAFPDFHLQVEHVFGDSEGAVVQWRARGTFTGAPFQGVDPNGKTIELRGVDVMTFRDGKLAYNTIYYDGAAFARGVGLLPPVGSSMEKMLFAGFNAVTAVRRTVGL